MKKKIFAFVFVFTTVFFLSLESMAQENNNYKHEIGTNVTSLFQFMFTESYTPVYNIEYKYHFKKSAFKLNFNTEFNKVNSDIVYSSLKNETKAYSIFLGYEHKSILSKNWELFYGLDLNYSYDYHYSENPYAYYFKLESKKSIGFGLGAVFGVKYKINERINLSTKTSYFYLIEEGTHFIEYINRDATNGIPENHEENLTTNSIEFVPPVFVTLSFNL